MSIQERSNFYYIEIILGAALATGHLTLLRFFGKVGISELLFLIVIVFFLKKYLIKIFSFKRDKESIFRAYFFASIFIVAPVTTLFVNSFSSSPIHIISFSMSMFLVFSLIQARLQGFSFKNATLWFLIFFCVISIITLYIYPIENVRFDGFRYTGGAKNPNQVVYYAQSLTLLVVVFLNRVALLFVPLIILLTLKTKSDAYMLSIVMSGIFYIFLRFFYLTRYSVISNIVIYIIPLLSIVLFILYNYQEEVVVIWNDAGGVARGGLYLNAIEVIKSSPLVGFGLGTFSGKVTPFEGTEAHSNIFDLAIQFGVLFMILIYYIFFKAISISIRKGEFIIASFMLAYVVTGFFHYTARHFVFWIEFSIFYYYVFYQDKGFLNDKRTMD